MNNMIAHIEAMPHLHGHDSTFVIAIIIALLVASAIVAATMRRK